ncbi:hypothetical protein [Tenacibaculum sp. 190524A02b]|uniref:hypothetical protein n=1 Tax=Tenacibaculum vairaonense TaxID=3137860 RepID=UPI0031FACBD0
MNKKLNADYFKVKEVHKKNYKKSKLTLKKIVANLLLAFVMIVIYSSLSKSCTRTINESKIEKIK